MRATKLTDSAVPAAGRARWWRNARAWEPLGLALCGALALGLALASPPRVPQQIWGMCAAFAYAAAALAAVRARTRWAPSTAVVATAGAVALPFVVLAALGKAQMEVGVIERAGELLLSTGSPYVENPSRVSDFNPYLPGMALFGLPSALFGDVPGASILAGPRWWLAACFLATMVAAARVAGLGRRTRPAVALVTALPAVALPLAIGGVDPPVVGLMCLGLAYAGRGDAVRSGVVLGLAAALKWTAWPALPVVFALLMTRGRGKAVLRCAVSAAVVLALVCVPVLVAGARKCVPHLVLYPLGLADVPSTAASPLPGHLLATYVPHGEAITLAALGVTAALMAASLLLRPPRIASAAADRIALGLTLAMLLAPATRSGYVIYPLLLFAWYRITVRSAERGAAAPVRVATACRYGRVHSLSGRRRAVRPLCGRALKAVRRHPRPERDQGHAAVSTSCAAAPPVRAGRRRR